MRRYLRPLLPAMLLWVAAAAFAGGIELASDLRADARASARDGAPLVVFFSSYNCPYCEKVASLHLEPLIARGSGAGAVRVREVEVASRKAMRDFTGTNTTHADFADRERVAVTPTVKFYGPDGAEIAKPLVGYSNADFYGEYLDASLRAAREGLAR
jgi:thioredoxin-related protein